MPGTAGTGVPPVVRGRIPGGPLISGVLYDRLLCCWAALCVCEAMTGREGPRGFRPLIPYGLGDGPSRDGALGMAGAVYRFVSSQPDCGVPVFGNGYAWLWNMLLAVLVRDDTGDSATGEKYESPGPPRRPGDCVPGGIWV